MTMTRPNISRNHATARYQASKIAGRFLLSWHVTAETLSVNNNSENSKTARQQLGKREKKKGKNGNHWGQKKNIR